MEMDCQFITIYGKSGHKPPAFHARILVVNTIVFTNGTHARILVVNTIVFTNGTHARILVVNTIVSNNGTQYSQGYSIILESHHTLPLNVFL